MNEKVFSSQEEMGIAIADEICALPEINKNPLICLAAGHSSLPVFQELVSRRRQGFDFSSWSFVAMDEWAGMSSIDSESCGGFLLKNLLDHVNISRQNTRLFDGKTACAGCDPAAECASVEKFIAEKGGIDFMLLGIGMNGHLALNEPGCDINAGARFTELSETTKTVGQKYFSSGMALTGGLTLGLKNILAARSIIVNVCGEHKAPVVKQLREIASCDTSFPAAVLKDVPYVKFYFDRDSSRQ